MESDAPSMAAVLGSFAVDAGLAWMTGCVAVNVWALGRLSSWARAMRVRHERGLVLASGWTALALAFDLWRRSADAADVPLLAAGHATATMLLVTHFGHAWTIAMACTMGIAATALFGRRVLGRRILDRRVLLTTWIVGIVALACTRSVVSHAGSQGDFSPAVASDVVHLVMVSLWVGAVWTSAWVMPGPADEDAADVGSWLQALSTVATIALTAIVVSGVANGWHATSGSPGALWGSSYGITLASKVGFVLVAAALGGVNRWIFLPRLLDDARMRSVASAATSAATRTAARGAFVMILRIEGIVLAGVLLLAAVLGNLEPPGSM